MTKEAHASQIYLSYGAWADNNGFSGIANFLFVMQQRNETI
jgi:ferritin